MKIILNKCYGGFDVSDEAYRLYAKKKGLELYKYESDYDFKNPTYRKVENGGNEISTCYFTKDFGEEAKISDDDYNKYCLYIREDYRNDEALIEVVEELGNRASGRFGELEIIEIPDNSFYKIDEYDGIETIYYSDSEIHIK